MSIQKLLYTLQIADNALILGHRISEWCGHGPILEQDIAITNTALDHLGQARSLYQYAATQFNALSPEERAGLFTSAALQANIANGKHIDEDDLAYLRDGWDFRNVLLVEQPNKDWAYTVARSFLYDCFSYFFYSALKNSKDETLAAIAEKSLKEVTYHIRWSSEWVIRLGDGTEESHARMQQALNDRWVYTGELVKMSEADNAMLAEGVGVDLNAIVTQWKERVAAVIEEATLTLPPDTWMQEGGKEGRHTEHLGYILAELQFMQRAYPNMEW
ncbi:1,2-phenylacetyl-CoA epoxidase subunit PaaC [Polluticoccus soli]|uniref:1,2-phenylacetyl-CoA epoxidase subunit PaaC n=1 Tax=Polluticoccus soli TaxID=3034150 RepID=UPI0023E2837B|nr:1,2-phenylacetyl-CoA epoxidase subunit PaaC [Flavipsychrobacter sp. JY13-12]